MENRHIAQNQVQRLKQAWKTRQQNFDPAISFFLPGFFIMDGKKGKYPSISITGDRCNLMCEHCQAKILKTMIAAPTPELLVQKCLNLARQGNHGVLISGGCDENGRLPWDEFIPAIKKIKQQTCLFVSIHSGIINEPTAVALKAAGVDQALIDIIGDDQTLREIYHVDFGISHIKSSLKALQTAGLPIVPHIVCGLYFGKIKGEKNAVAMISELNVDQVVILSVMKYSGTSFETVELPDPLAVADIIAQARLAMPDTPLSLGCARPRGGRILETLAIDAGINRMALPSDEALAHAKNLGLDIRYQDTCCSVPLENWN